MANIYIKRSHNLGLETARREVEKLAQSLGPGLRADYEWSDNSLMFKHPGASGTIKVGVDYIDVAIELGMALSFMKGTIEESINQRLDAALS